jgi:hypothetical protein
MRSHNLLIREDHMRRTVSFSAFVTATLFAVPLAAQAPANVAGKWEFTYSTQRGQSTVTVTFEQDGENLKGNAVTGGQRGGTFEISKATIKGDALTFAIVRTFGENTFEQTFTGKVTGDTAEGTMTGGGRRGGNEPIKWTAKKLPPGVGG